MEITELAPGAGLDFLMEILESFHFDDVLRNDLVGSFRKEIAEIGTNRIFLIGRVSGRAAAMGQLVLKNADNDPELADGKQIAHVHSLWVRRDLQRRGFAKAMMRKVEERATGLGFGILTLGVDDHNKSAVNLYGALGFQEFRREPGRCSGEELILMRKTLPSRRAAN